jgi:hypothetical protein
MSSLEVGFSHDIFVEMANEAKKSGTFYSEGTGTSICSASPNG